VDVRDSVDRAQLRDDPPWVRVTHDFQLVDTPGLAAPHDLAGESDPDLRPFMYLSWERANTPDRWSIWRGDHHVETVDGADLLAGPGQFVWVDRHATPNVTHTWSVRAVEIDPNSTRNDRQSSPAATWTGRIDTPHAWLVDWDSSPVRCVPILDPDVTFDMPDTSVTYEPINGHRVVRVSGPQRGMEGSVSGRIISFPDASHDPPRPLFLSDWRDALLHMKAHPNPPSGYHLMAGNRSWRVHIGDVVISPMRMPHNEAELVSFSFWSLDGPPQP
jgi:hypothetical protein